MYDRITPYFKTLKPKRTVTYSVVIVGAIVGNHYQLASVDWLMLFLFMFVFQLWYGAIYTINDLIDYPQDKKNPLLASRPLQSGAITIPRAIVYVISILLIASGLCLFVAAPALPFLLALLIYNVIYSLILNKIPYVDAFGNGIPHALRIWLGMTVFGFSISWPVILVCYLIAVNIGILKRLKEKRYKEPGRPTLSSYSFGFGRAICVSTLVLSLLLIPFGTYHDNILIAISVFLNAVGDVSFFGSKKTSHYVREIYNFF